MLFPLFPASCSAKNRPGFHCGNRGGSFVLLVLFQALTQLLAGVLDSSLGGGQNGMTPPDGANGQTPPAMNGSAPGGQAPDGQQGGTPPEKPTGTPSGTPPQMPAQNNATSQAETAAG